MIVDSKNKMKFVKHNFTPVKNMLLTKRSKEYPDRMFQERIGEMVRRFIKVKRRIPKWAREAGFTCEVVEFSYKLMTHFIRLDTTQIRQASFIPEIVRNALTEWQESKPTLIFKECEFKKFVHLIDDVIKSNYDITSENGVVKFTPKKKYGKQ